VRANPALPAPLLVPVGGQKRVLLREGDFLQAVLSLFVFGITSNKSPDRFGGVKPNLRGIMLENASISVSHFDRELLKHLSMCQARRQSSNLSPLLRHPLTPLDPAPTSSPRSFLIRNKKQ